MHAGIAGARLGRSGLSNAKATPEAAPVRSARDAKPLSQARPKLPALADLARGGAEKIVTKNGANNEALIDA